MTARPGRGARLAAVDCLLVGVVRVQGAFQLGRVGKLVALRFVQRLVPHAGEKARGAVGFLEPGRQLGAVDEGFHELDHRNAVGVLGELPSRIFAACRSSPLDSPSTIAFCSVRVVAPRRADRHDLRRYWSWRVRGHAGQAPRRWQARRLYWFSVSSTLRQLFSTCWQRPNICRRAALLRPARLGNHTRGP